MFITQAHNPVLCVSTVTGGGINLLIIIVKLRTFLPRHQKNLRNHNYSKPDNFRTIKHVKQLFVRCEPNS